MAATTYRGIHCVLYAFFEESGQLDRAAMARQTEFVLEAGVDGINVLGLATEVLKLSLEERRQIIDWAVEDIASKVRLSVTISGNSIAEQVLLADHATKSGADWLILQPPMAGSYPAEEYVAFFEAVSSALSLPWAIQNAPAYLGRSLSHSDLSRLKKKAPLFAGVKAESSAVAVELLVNTLGDDMLILNGRGGVEMIDGLRAGCGGFVLAPDAVDHAVSCWRSWQEGDIAGAERAYAEALPAINFIMQSLESLICYGKRVFGLRVGLPVFDRTPAERPTNFGLECAERHAVALGPWRERARYGPESGIVRTKGS